MGIVYRGRDESLDRDVAIKVLAGSDADGDIRARFESEAKAVARLQHPNIVTIYELGEHEGSPFMAMELLDGQDLQQALQAGFRPEPKAAVPIVLQLLAGLAHAHEQGIVHRDMKPSNVFLPRRRPTKIMDFGVARLGAGMKTRTGMVVGTPSYMSPEQASARPVDERSDLFSVGLILYELLTGERLFQGDSMINVVYRIAHEDVDLSALAPDAGRVRLEPILTRALARDRDARYPDAQSMAADLQQALKDLGGAPDWTIRSDDWLDVPAVDAQALPASEPTPVARPRWALAWAGGGLIALGVGGFLAVRGGGSSPSPQPPPSSAPVTSASITLPVSLAAKPSPSARPSPGPTVHDSPTEVQEPTALPVGRLDRAQALLEQGRYAAALEEARAVLDKEPGNTQARAIAEDAEAAQVVETRLKNARVALRRNDRETALAEVRAGLAVNGSDARLLSLFRELTQ